MKTCKKCGAQNAGYVTLCLNCGKSLKNVPNIPDPAKAPAPVEEAPITEIAVIEETVTEETVTEETVAEETVAEETVAEEAVTEETTVEETVGETVVAPAPAAPVATGTPGKGFAIAALICDIMCYLFIFALAPAILGLIFAGKSSRRGYKGALLTAARVLGIIGVILSAIFLVGIMIWFVVYFLPLYSRLF